MGAPDADNVDPEFDKQGLNSVPPRRLTRELEEVGEETFRQRYPCAFLVLALDPGPAGHDLDLKTTESSLSKFEASAIPSIGARVSPLLKSDRNGYKSKIMVGRARNNDVIIRASKISKLHASFSLDGKGGYSLQDMGSMNGTMVNGERLVGMKRTAVSSGDWISFWRYLFEFVGLDEMLKRLSAGSGAPGPAPKP
ncbi:MAG: FHA domain-containing protein [Planctomycetota bacterium]